MGKEVKEGHLALAKARYQAGDFSYVPFFIDTQNSNVTIRHSILHSVGEASFKVSVEEENASGIRLPKFKRCEENLPQGM